MPKDKSGKFHLGAQRAHSADRMAEAPKAAAPEPTADGAASGNASSTELYDHGDGTFHSEGPAGHTEHPHIGHALAHIHAQHGGGAKHMNVHSDGMGSHTTHHHSGDGQVEGPHDHENIEALKAHMDQFLGEEENEWKGEDYAKPEMAHEGGGRHGSGYGA